MNKKKSAYPDICPRCEDGVLTTNYVVQDITFAASLFRVPGVQVEECHVCGFRSLSGREVGLFELLFTPDFNSTNDLVEALRAAGYQDMFLHEEQTQPFLGFGSREYVAGLSEELRGFYLDNESHHLLEGLTALGHGTARIEVGSRQLTINLPRLGEGENGVVFDYREDRQSVLKLAKPRPYCRNHLRLEYELTNLFLENGIPVPQVLESDPYGSFMVKEKLAGESLAAVYSSLGESGCEEYRRVKATVEEFTRKLMELFRAFPNAKISISPNNIFIVASRDCCRCVLVDTGPAPFHDYSRFDFEEYWNAVIPQKIQRYKAVGYI